MLYNTSRGMINEIVLIITARRGGAAEINTCPLQIPLYAHLRMASTMPIRRPPTPELVRQTRLKRSLLKKPPPGSERQLTLPPEGAAPEIVPDRQQTQEPSSASNIHHS